MEKPTKEQIAMLNGHCNGYGIETEFKCPQCNVEQNIPQIETPGEDITQVRCVYGCGFVIL